MALNLANTATITAKTLAASITMNATSILVNANSSNSIYKINNIMISNYSANTVTSNVYISRGAVPYYIVGLVSVPSNSTYVVMGKDTQIYLEEGDSLVTSGGANSAMTILAGYELLS
jgi:hypothetical protein